MTDSGDRGPNEVRSTIGEVPLPPGYVLVGRLGAGGFATVWLAEQGQLGRRVAVKLLGEALSDSETERRFLAECRAIGSLSGHPAVVTVHDAGTTEHGRPYLVMEHLPGGSLQDRLATSGPLPWPDAVDAAVAVGDALAAAHAAGILHRDVKPANVLLDTHGRPKLGDFGIARLSEGQHTATGTLVGTIPFTPPEVLSGHRPGPTADVWALGATLHALLTGTSPFSGDRDEPPAATIARVLRSEAPPLPPSVPTDVAGVVFACLAADPGARPQSAAEVVAALQGIQAARGLPVTSALVSRSTPPPTPTPDATVPTPAVTGRPPTPTRPDVPPAADASAATEAWTSSTPTPTPAPPVTPTAPPTPVPRDAEATVATGPATVAAGPVVGPPPVTGPPPITAPAPPGRPRRRGLLVAALVVVALVIAAAVVAVVVGLGGDDGDDSAADTGEETTLPPGDAEEPIVALTGVDGRPLATPAAPAATPMEVWTASAPCGDGCVTAGAGDLAVVVDGTGAITAIDPLADAGDDAVRWTAAIDPEQGRLRAVVGPDLVIVSALDTDGEGRTYTAFDRDDGTERWPVTVTDLAGLAPIVDGEPTVVFRAADPDDGNPDGLDLGSTHVVDAATGETTWWVRGHVVGVTDDLVVVGDGTTIRGRERASGTVRWEADLASGPTVATQGLPRATVIHDVVVAAVDEEVVGVGLDDGSERWRLPVAPSSRPDDTSGAVIALPGDGSDPLVVVAGRSGHSGVTADGEERWSIVGDGLLSADEVPFWLAGPGWFLVARADASVALHSNDDGEVTTETVVEGAAPNPRWGVLDGQLVTRTSAGAVGLDLGRLVTVWSVAGDFVQAIPADEGFVAVTADGVARYRSPA